MVRIKIKFLKLRAMMSDKIETIDVGEVNWNATAVQYMELNKQKTEAIQRVRELHIQESEITTFCKECSFMYPCDTIKALDCEIGSVEPVKLVALNGEQG